MGNGRQRQSTPTADGTVPIRPVDVEAVIAFFETDVFWAAFTDRGLAALSFDEPAPLDLGPRNRVPPDHGPLHRGNPARDPLHRNPLSKVDLRQILADKRGAQWERQLVLETVRFLKTGRHKLPLDFSGCTPFQRRVYEAVAGIAPGRLCTYKHVAMMIGQPLAARAVGNALAREPFDFLLPAHRVVPQGGLGLIRDGSASGRLKLLAREGHDIGWLAEARF